MYVSLVFIKEAELLVLDCWTLNIHDISTLSGIDEKQ